uniref:Uncharacterized protein n=1 Tax=Panagrellus redivivus TaxID=6233 RepID=A0A7E4W903_PANRE
MKTWRQGYNSLTVVRGTITISTREHGYNMAKIPAQVVRAAVWWLLRKSTTSREVQDAEVPSGARDMHNSLMNVFYLTDFDILRVPGTLLPTYALS